MDLCRYSSPSARDVSLANENCPVLQNILTKMLSFIAVTIIPTKCTLMHVEPEQYSNTAVRHHQDKNTFMVGSVAGLDWNLQLPSMGNAMSSTCIKPTPLLGISIYLNYVCQFLLISSNIFGYFETAHIQSRKVNGFAVLRCLLIYYKHSAPSGSRLTEIFNLQQINLQFSNNPSSIHIEM